MLSLQPLVLTLLFQKPLPLRPSSSLQKFELILCCHSLLYLSIKSTADTSAFTRKSGVRGERKRTERCSPSSLA
ncbi:hypothetical protein F2Q69_00042945 [Brassica cretica]|uniref:Uncharacterized protein n=1 Tax=Brassica cretica TaxID=69181 RepID=A0A8S9NMA3_BRACR|nr:hypothetical protein F2Q69_00042945 [Brassica cretica]